MRYSGGEVPLNVRRFVHIFLRPSFFLAWSSFSPGPWLVHFELLVAVGYLIVRPGLPLLQVGGRVYLSLLGLHSAQRARKSLGLVRFSSFFLFS